MKKVVPLKTARKIISDAVSNSYVDIKVLGNLSDSLKMLTMSYMYGENNHRAAYGFIYENQQELVIDFLYEVYYHILAHGYDVEFLKNLKSSVSEYLDSSSLSDPIKGMVNTNTEQVDILFSTIVFLRLFLKQFDTELIKRNNLEQKLNQ